jgi:DNA-binding IclR family transcriptional regulator
MPVMNGAVKKTTFEGAPATSSVVKSAGRAFEVLELFRAERRQLSAAEIGQALGYPKSSTNALLKSLVSLGYLVLDHRSRRYFPSVSVARLGDRVPAALLGSGRAFAALSEVHAATQETVTLTVQSDLSVNFLKVIPGTFPISLSMTEGFIAPLFGTAVGTAILSQLSDAEILALAERANARTRRRAAKVDPQQGLRVVRDAKERGFVVLYEAVFPDTGAIAVPFPSEIDGLPMAIGVGGLSERIRRNERSILRALRAAASRHGSGARGRLGPRRAVSSNQA